MRAAVYHSYGDPSVLSVEDVPEPHAGPVQVRIHASLRLMRHAVRSPELRSHGWPARAPGKGALQRAAEG